MALFPEFFNSLMQAALLEAQKAAEADEVPVGAALSLDGEIIATAHNLVEKNQTVTAHAEMLVIERAGKIAGSWRLNDAVLAVTLEPCTMCIGAIKLARVSTVLIAAPDPRTGACGSIYDLAQDPRAGAVPRIIHNIRAEDSQQLLQQYFNSKRKKG